MKADILAGSMPHAKEIGIEFSLVNDASGNRVRCHGSCLSASYCCEICDAHYTCSQAYQRHQAAKKSATDPTFISSQPGGTDNQNPEKERGNGPNTHQ